MDPDLGAGSRRTPTAARAAIVNVGAIEGGFGWRVSRTPHHTDLFLDVRVPPTKPMGVARREVLEFVRSLAERFPDYGVEGEVYVTAPGAEIDEDHELVQAIDAAHAEVYGEMPGRDVTRWFSDASALTRYGMPTVNYGTSTGLMDVELGENLDIDGLVKMAHTYALVAQQVCAMKLVTYDDGKVGRVDGDEVVRLDVPTMREYFERGGADDTAERVPLADVRLRAPIVPKKFFHTAGNFREHEEESKNVDWSHADRAVDQLLPERRRDHRPGRADRLSGAPDRGARLRARARGRARRRRQVVRSRGGGGLHRRLRDLQRHHRARHPARRDALGRLQLLQGDRHVLPARAVDRHPGRDPRPARPGDGAARQRRDAPGVALRAA